MFEEKGHQSLDKTFLLLKTDFFFILLLLTSIHKKPYNLTKNLQKDNLFNYCPANLCEM